MNPFITATITILLSASSVFAQPFSHGVTEGPTPWTDKDFDVGEDRFMFAIHSDLTGGERPQVFEIAIAQLNLLRPEFVISVGDLIEGGDVDRDQHLREWEEYDRRVETLKAPVFYVGGNHDLSTLLSQEIWQERLGPSYYHFRYKDVLFLVLNTEDNTPSRIDEIAVARAEAVEIYKTEGHEAFAATEYNQMPERASGTISTEQAAYFRVAIADNPDVRWTFLFVHKPAWNRQGDKAFSSSKPLCQTGLTLSSTAMSMSIITVKGTGGTTSNSPQRVANNFRISGCPKTMSPL